MEPLYTVEQAAEILQAHPKTVREWLRTKKLRGVSAGRFRRVKESDLPEFLREPHGEQAPMVEDKPPRKRM
jgi:excisionase family DNA binding protein